MKNLNLLKERFRNLWSIFVAIDVVTFAVAVFTIVLALLLHKVCSLNKDVKELKGNTEIIDTSVTDTIDSDTLSVKVIKNSIE